jgi:hypothetical protein
MKKRYNIIFNAEKPTSEEIAKHQNFDALMKQFEVEKPATIVPKRRLGMRRWALVAASFAAIVVVSFAIQRQFFSTIFNSNSSENIAVPFVNPPIEDLEMPFESVEIDAENGGEIMLSDGTRLILPKAAFINKNGEKISGTVRLDYRKFQNLSDIFLSGIPMQYDSANATYQMSTVGMMELEGFYKNEPILINPKKAISVQLASIQDLEKIEAYNVYYLNETAKNWEYKAVDKFELVLDAATQKRIDAALSESEIVKNIAETQGEIKAIRNKNKVSETTFDGEFGDNKMNLEKPMPPKAPNPNNFVLDFDFSDFEQPINDSSTYNANAYLTEYEDVIWEVSADQQTAYEKAISGTIWNNVDLQAINNQQFKLRLASGSRKVELILTPVLEAEELAIAQAKYRIALADYNSKIRANQSGIQADSELSEADELAIKALEKEMANLQTAYSKARIAAMKTMNLDLRNQKIINQFEVNQFGIWNCDKPKLVENRQVSAKFQDATGKAVDFYMVYIANKTKGNVQRFYTNQKIAINYNESDENILWLVTKDGAIAVADNAEFEKIGNKKQHIFTLKNAPNFVQNKADLKQILGL